MEKLKEGTVEILERGVWRDGMKGVWRNGRETNVERWAEGRKRVCRDKRMGFARVGGMEY